MSSYLLLQLPKFDTRDAVSRWWLILERRLLQSWTTNSAPVNCQLSAQSHMGQQKHTKSRTCSLTDTVKPTINITSNLMTELHRVHNDYSSFSDAGLETWGENRPLGERVLEPSVTETVSERKQNDKHNPGCQITIVLVWMCFCYCSIQLLSSPVYDNKPGRHPFQALAWPAVSEKSAQHGSKHSQYTLKSTQGSSMSVAEKLWIKAVLRWAQHQQTTKLLYYYFVMIMYH